MSHDSTRDAASPSLPPAPTAAPRPDPWFRQAADWIVRGGAVLGTLRAIQLLASAWDAGGLGAADLALAGYSGVLHAVAGLAMAAPIRALGEWLGRPAAVVSTLSSPSPAPGPAIAAAGPPQVDDLGDALAEARRLIREEEWEPVDDLVAGIAAGREADARVSKLVDDVARAKRDAADRWRGRLQAAREANDAARVLELYESPPPGIDPEVRQGLDLDLAKWFLALIHRRLRSGMLQVDVVVLVDRASETFGHTREGASLRAALPTLRRGAGLCPRCGKPYVGYADACPACLGRPEPPPPYIPELEPRDEFEPETEREGTDAEWFLDPEEGPNGQAPR